ncbi:MAG: hypothetical protein WD749_14950 [Phycisphaerales bacterium]
MHPPARVLETVHAGTLGVWLGVLVMTGAGAAVVFPEMRSLDPRLPDFAAYGGEHWLIAGGRVAQRLFTVSDIAQLGLFCVFVATFTAMVLGRALAPRWREFRLALALLLLGVLAYRFGVLGPRMASDLGEYWSAARAGDGETAARAKAAFDADHPLGSRLIGASAALVALSLIASLVSLGRASPALREGE